MLCEDVFGGILVASALLSPFFQFPDPYIRGPYRMVNMAAKQLLVSHTLSAGSNFKMVQPRSKARSPLGVNNTKSRTGPKCLYVRSMIRGRCALSAAQLAYIRASLYVRWIALICPFQHRTITPTSHLLKHVGRRYEQRQLACLSKPGTGSCRGFAIT
jgi:hypothetical protein